MPYILQTQPFRVPTTDGKRIEEHFGLATTGDGRLSLAYMEAPPHWAEPFQQPDFDEFTLLLQGRKLIEIDEAGQVEQVVLSSGQSILITAGTRMRYSNPFDEPNQYVAICMPAFSIQSAHRDAD